MSTYDDYVDALPGQRIAKKLMAIADGVQAAVEANVALREEEEPETRTPCAYCGEPVLACDVLVVQTARQTHWNPAEYETFCDKCLPSRYREREEA